MTTQVGVTRNLWSTQQSGLMVPKRMNLPLDSLELFLPLWHPELSGASFKSKDLNAQACVAVGGPQDSQGRVFDGDDYITMTGASQLDFTGDFSIVYHVKHSGLAGHQYIIVRGTDGVAGYRIFHHSGGAVYFSTWNASGEQQSNTAANTVVVGTWYTIGHTRIGATVTTFRNGIDVSNVQATHVSPVSNNEIAHVGESNEGTTRLTANLSMFMACSKALTAREHSHIHNMAKRRDFY